MMKKKHLVRQFQIHMIITVAIIALITVVTFFGIEERQNKILPDKTSIYIDVTSNYADGSSETDTYSIDLDKTNQPKTYEKTNPVDMDEKNSEVIQYDDNFILISLDEDGEYETQVKSNMKGKVILDKSKIQMGTSISVSSIRNAFSMLGEKKQALYTKLEYFKFGLPIAYFLFGILISCFLFYILRIKKPVAIMEEATGKIAQNNLDFVIKSNSKNELGRLCDSLESMRGALAANTLEMFHMMNEKRKLQSSVSHDLRNPIAIMKGYLEMLDSDLKRNDISKESLEDSICTLSTTVERMEEYVESVNRINHFEDMELNAKSVDIEECFHNWKKDLLILGEKNEINIDMTIRYVSDRSGKDRLKTEKHEYEEYVIDTKAISRVLENIVTNSCRYAKEKIEVTLLAKEKDGLEFLIQDDGPGYTEKLIKNPDLYFYTTEQQFGHMGMGLTICRILCAKHKGNIVISNGATCGAITKINIKSLTES